jgi:hypothetical protein
MPQSLELSTPPRIVVDNDGLLGDPLSFVDFWQPASQIWLNRNQSLREMSS